MGAPLELDAFPFADGRYTCAGVPLEQVAATYGTPTFVYSADELGRRYRAINHAMADLVSRDGERPLVCFAVKANPNLSVLRTLVAQGAGFGVASQGELVRVLEAGARADHVVWSGSGKSAADLEAAVAAGIGLITIDAAPELDVLESVMGHRAPDSSPVRVALRIRPDVDTPGHAYWAAGHRRSKFGIDPRTAITLGQDWPYKRIELAGIHLHIGSQVGAAGPYAAALSNAADVALAWTAAGRMPQVVDLGGGFSVSHERGRGSDFNLGTFAAAIERLFDDFGRPRLLLEPGSYIASAAGALLTRVRYVKRNADQTVVVVDAGMNDLLRPSLYRAWHAIWPVAGHGEVPAAPTDGETPPPPDTLACDVVGPVSETGDFLALGRDLPEIEPGTLLVVFHAGAYAQAMASNYNTRPRPAEILIENGTPRLIRRRETVDDLLAPERGL